MRDAKVRAVHLDKHFYLVMAPKSSQHNPDKHKVISHPIVSVRGQWFVVMELDGQGQSVAPTLGCLCRCTDVSRKMSTAGSSVMS